MELKKITCIVCPNGCKLTIIEENEELLVEGNKCKRGIEFGINEIKNPLRSIASTVNTIYKEMPRLPVRTDGLIPKSKIFNVMREISKVVITNHVDINEVIIENVLNTGVNIISTSSLIEILKEEYPNGG
ncbi:DUF1667 domain-containing protein [uncultured Clostridium sp.]|uniref:DUF1667 domain-containing protein n=1 Tax=uncultured Clostridium sp. TaxID=59620 RepID=UPI0032163151